MSSPLLIRRAGLVVRWLCLLLLLPALATADVTTGFGDKKKKKKDDEGFLPEAKPVNVRFIAGTAVEIELNAAVASLGAVHFAIREQPQHGTLSVIRSHPREPYKALVTYTPNPGDAVLTDRFTYACKLDTGSWSAPSPVSLVGKRAEPRIEIMQTTAFGRVLPGFEGSSRVVLKNTGIAPFAADMQWQAPWTGPPRVELGIGEQKEYLITVKPSAPGTLIWETEIQHGEPKSKIRLYVECAEPFVVAPGLVKMQFVAATGDRHGKVGVANATDSPMRFVIEAPDRIQAPKDLEVPGKQSVQIDLKLAAADVQAFHGELWVVSTPYRQRVLLEAAPEPPQVVLVSPTNAAIDFGTQPKGKMTQAKLTLQNVGGEAAVLAAQAAPPFRVVETDAAASIGPGEKREMTVECISQQAGKFTGNIIFSGTGGQLSIAASYIATDPNMPQPIRPTAGATPKNSRAPVARAASASKIETPPPAPEKGKTAAPSKDAKSAPDAEADKSAPDEPKFNEREKIVLAYLATWGIPVPKELLSSTLKKIEGIGMVKRGTDHLVIQWDEPAAKPVSYKVQVGYKMFGQTSHRWVKSWRDIPGVAAVNGGAGKHAVRCPGLKPETRYEIRVLGVDDKEKVSEPSDILITSTTGPWRWPSWTWQALIAVALVIFIVIYVLLKRGKWDL
ncbi:MAG: fibronectin type III domain-containing protein [Verrucomicrobiaceae bacterium]|nr:fibronectin type III domain-containing protein [Verrucomicrobiaceae bacterium]